jgi:spermidine/putrescine transport system ATP-binding protein
VVTDRAYVGVSSQYLVRTGWGTELTVFAPNTDHAGWPVGGEVVAHWHQRHAFLLDRPAVAGEPATDTPAQVPA